MKIEEDEKLSTLKTAITKFLNEHTIYEAIPEDMKILVFNDELLIKDSIEAMIKEDIYCGLLYNSKENKNSGIFTIRDVLGLLLIGYKKLILFLNTEKEITSYEMLKENSNKFFGTFDNVNEEKKNMFNSNEDLIVSKQLEGKEENNATNNNNDMEIEDEKNANENNDNNNMNKNIQEKEVKDEETKAYNNIIKDFNHFISLFENITLQSFIDLFHIKDNVNLISLFSEANLEECVKTIQNNNIHRLIVNDKKTNNLSGFITYETIFEFFIENYYSEMTEFNIPLNQINIVINNVITLNKNETLYKCMETFYKAGISMLPILDDDNKIFGYFYLKDIIYFFSMGEKFNFNNTVENFLKDLYEDIDDELPYGKRRIKELNDDTNLKKVFEEMSTSPERKLIIKNDDSKIGIIALYDIFKKLVI
jgi:predicted transcriptional regulator